MAASPRASVVVPAHDRAATIERTVASILAAADVLDPDPAAVEVLVVDDGSTDDTAAVVAGLAARDSRVTSLSQPNAGVSAARNAGLRAATGEVLAFVDADDEVVPRWLALLVGALDDGADLAFGAGEGVRPGSTAVEPWAPRPLGPAYAGVTGLFNPGCFAVRREVVVEAGGFATPLRFSENTELGLRICAVLEARGPVRATVVPGPVVTIHLPARGASNAWSDRSRYESALYVAEVHHDRLARDPRLHASYWAIAGVAAARLDRPRDASRCFRRAFRANPRSPRHLARATVALLPPLSHHLWPPTP